MSQVTFFPSAILHATPYSTTPLRSILFYKNSFLLWLLTSKLPANDKKNGPHKRIDVKTIALILQVQSIL